MTTTAIVLASGSGSRFGGDIPKQFQMLAAKPVYAYSLETFLSHKLVDNLVVVAHPDYREAIEKALEHSKKPILVVEGGASRQASAFKGLQAARTFSPEIVLIHDAARPLVSTILIDRVLSGLISAVAVSPVIAVSDTLYEVSEKGAFLRAVARNNLRRVQTPQGFRFQQILNAHERAIKDNRNDFTDDVLLIDAYQLGEIACVEGDPENIKLTTPSDEAFIQHILNRSVKKI